MNYARADAWALVIRMPQYKADPCQGERLLEGCGLAGDCKSVATPGSKPLLEQLEADRALPAGEVTEL